MKLLLVTRNQHKAQEFGQMLQFEVLTLEQIGFTQAIEETGSTFEANAKIKVQAVLEFLRAELGRDDHPGRLRTIGDDRPYHFTDSLIVLADDSGLEVDALNGAPGVISARYAGEPSNDQANTAKLLKELTGIPGPKRTGRFRCVIAAVPFEAGKSMASITTFEGSCPGKIGFKPKGSQGFGYDPVFFPEGFCRTFAELEAEEKNSISHRSKAVAGLKKWLNALQP